MSERKIKNISMPELAFIAVTRVAIGVGIGLLLANKLSTKHRKAIGIPLLAASALSTIPIAMKVFSKEI